MTSRAISPNQNDQSHAGALIVLADRILVVHKAQIIEFAAKIRLPAIYATEEHAETGGLITSGPDMEAQFRRGEVDVDKTLKGANPANTPLSSPPNSSLPLISIPLKLVSRLHLI